jgi:hypothetical protein
MAVGVPETDVFAAADAVLACGERPTVERVRLELGRSPARVGGLLDQWWARLAERRDPPARIARRSVTSFCRRVATGSPSGSRRGRTGSG